MKPFYVNLLLGSFIMFLFCLTPLISNTDKKQYIRANNEIIVTYNYKDPCDRCYDVTVHTSNITELAPKGEMVVLPNESKVFEISPKAGGRWYWLCGNNIYSLKIKDATKIKIERDNIGNIYWTKIN